MQKDSGLRPVKIVWNNGAERVDTVRDCKGENDEIDDSVSDIG